MKGIILDFFFLKKKTPHLSYNIQLKLQKTFKILHLKHFPITKSSNKPLALGLCTALTKPYCAVVNPVACTLAFTSMTARCRKISSSIPPL